MTPAQEKRSREVDNIVIVQLMKQLYAMFEENYAWRHWFRTMHVEMDVAYNGKTKKIEVIHILGRKNIRNWRAK